MANSEDEPTLVIKLKMATSSATSGSAPRTLESKTPKRLPTLYDTVIDVNVGPTQERFVVHKNLLCHNSSYFKAALEGGFEESETEVINLRDEDPDVFWAFKEWLYLGAVAYRHYTTNETWSALLNLYVFAEKRIIPRLQNALIDAMIEFADEYESWPRTEIRLAWVNTATSSPLHGFLTALYARNVLMAEVFHQDAEERKCYDMDFVMEVAIALDNDRGEVVNGLWKDRCLWHVHGPEDPPCRDESSLTGSK